MLIRIKRIQGIGTFTDTSAGGAELTNVTVIYGENRYGKSTLCDILRSLAEDSPEYILDRTSIPSDPAKPPKVSFQFSTATGSSIPKFDNGQWQEKIPDCSKIYLITTKPQLALKFAVASVMCLLQPEQAALSYFPAQIGD